MTTGDRLKSLRLSKEYSMEKLAEELNEKYNLKITKSMMSRWESGKSEPTNIFAAAYARYFNVKLDYILGLIDEKESLDASLESPRFRWVARNARKLTEEELSRLQTLMQAAFNQIDFDKDEDEEE